MTIEEAKELKVGDVLRLPKESPKIRWEVVEVVERGVVVRYHDMIHGHKSLIEWNPLVNFYRAEKL